MDHAPIQGDMSGTTDPAPSGYVVHFTRPTESLTMAVRTTISEAHAERTADTMVMRRLSTDRAYKNAESAALQASREIEIEAQVWREIEERYEVE